jgi:hypothetical protein
MSASKEAISMPDARRLRALYSVKKNKIRRERERRVSGRLQTPGLMQSGERLPQILEKRARARNPRSRILPCRGRRDAENGFLHRINELAAATRTRLPLPPFAGNSPPLTAAPLRNLVGDDPAARKAL